MKSIKNIDKPNYFFLDDQFREFWVFLSNQSLRKKKSWVIFRSMIMRLRLESDILINLQSCGFLAQDAFLLLERTLNLFRWHVFPYIIWYYCSHILHTIQRVAFKRPTFIWPTIIWPTFIWPTVNLTDI